jgi:N-acetylmuramoyl-L-alanine amidase
MHRGIWQMAALISILPAAAATNTGLIQVTAVRAWPSPEATRVILETSGPFEYRADHAANPDRLFFDILNARPWIDQKRYITKEIGSNLVQRIRIAETAPGTTRIVFDLAAPAKYTVTRLDLPDRMVIEFRPAAEPDRPAPQVRVETTRERRTFVYPALPPMHRAQIQMPPAPVLYYLPQITAFNLLTDPLPKAEPVVAHATAPAAIRAVSADSSATTSENASRSLTRALGLKVGRIVIDAGHGGHDEGTSGPHGVLEKDVVLDVALRLEKLIEERMSADVVLTRSDDTFIPLHERTNIANARKADLFLSIHANSSPAKEVAGTETYFLNFTSSPGALDVAARENAGSEKNVGDLKDLIQSITLNDKIEESQTFAQSVQNAIQAQAMKTNPAAHNRGIKRAPFVVLIGAGMPSILAEIGFLSNPKDESNLSKPDYRQKVAEALYKGLAQYATSLSHFEPAAAPKVVAKQVASK